EHPVRLVRVRGPDLLAVHDEVVAVEHRARLERGEVAAGARLRVALTPADLAAHDLRQVLPLLLLGAELEQGRADHREAEADQRRGQAAARQLLAQHPRLLAREAAAAVLARPLRGREAALGARIEPALAVGVGP